MITAESSPARLGIAVGVGVWVSCSPFFGLHLLIALAIAWPLRLNKLAVAIGTQFSLPPLIPFVAIASANVGELILHGRLLPMGLDALRAVPPAVLIRQIGLAWLVGGCVVGALAGAAVGALVAVFATRYRNRAGASSASLAQPGRQSA
jgi:uncharacterized protein (DUF2062 family)